MCFCFIWISNGILYCILVFPQLLQSLHWRSWVLRLSLFPACSPRVQTVTQFSYFTHPGQCPFQSSNYGKNPEPWKLIWILIWKAGSNLNTNEQNACLCSWIFFWLNLLDRVQSRKLDSNWNLWFMFKYGWKGTILAAEYSSGRPIWIEFNQGETYSAIPDLPNAERRSIRGFLSAILLSNPFISLRIQGFW